VPDRRARGRLWARAFLRLVERGPDEPDEPDDRDRTGDGMGRL
jgi:hypothetical protein